MSYNGALWRCLTTEPCGDADHHWLRLATRHTIRCLIPNDSEFV